MSEDNKETQNRQEVDLSQLSNIEFATAWTPSSSIKKDFGDKKFSSFQRPRRDDSRRDGGSRDFKNAPISKKISAIKNSTNPNRAKNSTATNCAILRTENSAAPTNSATNASPRRPSTSQWKSFSIRTTPRSTSLRI